MACQVGTTTEPDKKRAFWEKAYPETFKNWRIEHACHSRTEAEERKAQLAGERGCKASLPGDGIKNAVWYVYSFEHNHS